MPTNTEKVTQTKHKNGTVLIVLLRAKILIPPSASSGFQDAFPPRGSIKPYDELNFDTMKFL